MSILSIKECKSAFSIFYLQLTSKVQIDYAPNKNTKKTLINKKKSSKPLKFKIASNKTS